MFDTTIYGPTLLTTTTYGAAVDTGDGVPICGQWVKFTTLNVLGLPNVKLICQTSPDGVSWMDNVNWDGDGSGSPLVNTLGNRYVLFQSNNRYWRWGVIFFANDPSDTVPGSGNSSSSSGQSAVSSSSSGGSAAMLIAIGIVPSKGG